MDVDEFKRVAKRSAKSKLEDAFRSAWRRLAIPLNLDMPQEQHKFHPDRKWRFDFSWPSLRLALEIQGGSWRSGRHNTATGQAGDYDKGNAAIILGWSVLHFNTIHMKDPDEVARTVLDAAIAIAERSQ